MSIQPNFEKTGGTTRVKEPRLIPYALFWAVWFLVLPLGGAYLITTVLSAPEAQPAQGILGALKNFGREQPVPVFIIAFTMLEMLFWSQRHNLPGASTFGSAGRAGLPPELRRRFDRASAMLEEADRILKHHGREVERAYAQADREAMTESMDRLRASMQEEPFRPEAFQTAFASAEQQLDRYLAPWRKGELREYAESIGIAVAVALLLRAFVVEAFKIPSPSMVPTLQVGDHIFVNKSAYGPMVPWTNTRLFANLPPHYGDVMVFQFPEKPEQDFIKRVVALPGDKLEALDGRPIINGWRPPECYVGNYAYAWGDGLAAHDGELTVEYLGDEAFLAYYDRTMLGATGNERARCDRDSDCEPGLACRAHLCGELQGPFRVQPGEVWVMGDNRNNSHDSRSWWEGKGGGVPFDFIKGRALVIWMSFVPSGGFAWDRIGISVMGRPKMPPAESRLQPAVERCFRSRPPLSETTPPQAERAN